MRQGEYRFIAWRTRSLNPDSAIESCLGSLGRPFRSEANGLARLSTPPWPVHGVAVSKQVR